MLDWIETIGPLVLSWPVVGLLVILLFRKQLLNILEQFSGTNILKARIGPLEVERELDKLAGQVDEQKLEQEKQRAEIETLRFLISYFVSEAELVHLEKLAAPAPFPYRKIPSFETELRRLRSFGLVRNLPGRGLGNLPSNGDLKEHFEITERGLEYLELRKNAAD